MVASQGSLRANPAPDGGWGWVIVASLTFSMTVYNCQFPTFGLIFGQFLEELQVGTQGISYISSLSFGLSSLVGLFTNYCIQKWGFRKCGFICALFWIIGGFATVFAQNYWQLLIAYSVLPGIGGGFLFIGFMAGFNDYWEKRRTFAMSLVQLISGILSIIAPLFIEYLMTNFGFRGTLLICAGINCNFLVCVAVSRPIDYSEKPSHVAINEDTDSKDEDNEEESLLTQISSTFDLNIFSDPVIFNIMFGLTLILFAEVLFSTLHPIYLMHIGLTRAESALCITAAAFADVVGRMLLMVFGYFYTINNRTVVHIGTFLSFIVRVGFMMIHGFIPLILVSSLLGLVRSLVLVCCTLVIAENVPHERFAGAMGIFNFLFGVAFISLSPFVGWLLLTSILRQIFSSPKTEDGRKRLISRSFIDPGASYFGAIFIFLLREYITATSQSHIIPKMPGDNPHMEFYWNGSFFFLT